MGRPFPQVVLNSGERLDDRVGYRFALVTDQPCSKPDLSDVVILSASEHPEMSSILSEFGTSAILVSPDRYVRGIGDDAGTLLKEFTPIFKTENESLVQK